MEDTKITLEDQEFTDKRSWFALEIDETAEALRTSIDGGLDAKLAASRLDSHGPNELTAAPKPPF